MKKIYKYKNDLGRFTKVKPNEIVVVLLDKKGYTHQCSREPANASIKYILQLVEDMIDCYKDNFQSIKYVIQDNVDITSQIECQL